jgi:hypothetical protein
MKIQIALAEQRTKIEIHRSAKAVPTCEPFFLLALNVPERIDSHTENRI